MPRKTGGGFDGRGGRGCRFNEAAARCRGKPMKTVNLLLTAILLQ